MGGLKSDDPVDRGREQDPVARLGRAQSPAESEVVLTGPAVSRARSASLAAPSRILDAFIARK